MNKKIQKILLALLLFTFLNMVFTPSARADEWGASMAATIFQITREQMLQSIKETIIANLKMAAIRIIQTRLMSLLQSTGVPVDGVAGAIISDWKMFIFSSASKYSTAMTNDFFNNLNAGATSAMRQYVTGPARRAVNVDYYNMRPDLQNYVRGGDPSKIFTPGYSSNYWMGWRVSLQQQNDLGSTYLRLEDYKQAAYEQEVAAKQSEGQSGGGYASTERKLTVPGPKDREMTTSSGAKVSVPAGSTYQGQNITTTGSDKKELANEIMIRMKTQMLTLARSIPEVATAMVNQMIAQVIQQGASMIANPGSSGGGMNFSSIGSAMSSQMQGLVQNGVRTMASPNMFFGR